MTKRTSEQTDRVRGDDDQVKAPPDEVDEEIEEGVEELAATFGAGPKAAPPPKGPMEGQQYAP